MDKLQKQEIIAKYGRKEGDTGSPEVQIALLTGRIQELTEHLKVHTKGDQKVKESGAFCAPAFYKTGA